MKIKIIREISLKDFENKINELISKGWKLKGGLAIGEDSYLYQMLAKK